MYRQYIYGGRQLPFYKMFYRCVVNTTASNEKGENSQNKSACRKLKKLKTKRLRRTISARLPPQAAEVHYRGVKNEKTFLSDIRRYLLWVLSFLHLMPT